MRGTSLKIFTMLAMVFSLGSKADTTWIPIIVGDITTFIPYAPNEPFVAPANAQLSNVGGVIRLSWDNVEHASKYEIQGLNAQGQWVSIVTTDELFAVIDNRFSGFTNIRVTACSFNTCISSGSWSGSVNISAIHEQANPSIPQSPASISLPNDPIGETIGLTAGNFRVNESGAATYSIPLVVPSGIAGVAPSISLNYNSSAGNGSMGVGWSVGGLSGISRCRQTFEQDTEFVAVELNAEDRFCLDGQRLIMVSGSSYGAANSEYRTEIASKTRIIARGTSGDGPAYFEVERVDGSLSYYGNYGNSATSYLALGNNDTIVSWFLGEFHDNIGKANSASERANSANKVNFNYSASNSYGENETVIESITYSGNTIDFSYTSKVNDQHEGYIAGYKVEQKSLLNDVYIKSHHTTQAIRSYHLTYEDNGYDLNDLTQLTQIQECNGSSSGTCLPATSFDWKNTLLPLVHGYDSEFRVVDFLGATPIDVNADGYSDVAYWYKSQNSININFKLGNGNGSFSDQINPVLINFVQEKVDKVRIKVIDVNGDGFQDIAVRSGDTNEYIWKLYVNTPSINVFIPQTLDVTTATINFTDLTGNGLVDMFYRENNINIVSVNINGEFQTAKAAGFPELVHSNTSVHGTVTSRSTDLQWFDGKVADFNGDGMADALAQIYDKTIYLDAEIDDCTTTHIYSYHQVFTRHFDESGSISFVPYAVLPGNAVEKSSSGRDAACKYSDDNSNAGGETYFSDVNGDGLSDIIQKNKSSGSWEFLASNGDGFENAVPVANLTGDIDNAQFIDANFDGRLDFIYYQEGCGIAARNWCYNTFSNGSFDNKESINLPTLDNTKEVGLWLNITGKDAPEYMVIDYVNHKAEPYIYNQSMASRIKVITNGFGLETNIDFKPITDTSVYTRGEGAELLRQGSCNPIDDNESCSPVFDIIAPIYVVSNVTSDMPGYDVTGTVYDEDNTVSVSYHYEGMKAQAGGRGMLGFNKLTTTDNQTQIVTSTTYHQEFPFIGMPLETESKNASGQRISYSINEVRNDRKLHNHLINSDFTDKEFIENPYVYQTQDYKYALNSDGSHQLISKVVSTNTYTDTQGSDNYVNLTGTEVISFVGASAVAFNTVETVNVYAEESEANWWLGRITSATVTNNRPTALEQPIIVRNASFEYDFDNGNGTGLLTLETANSGTNAELNTLHCYNLLGGEITTISYANVGAVDCNTEHISTGANLDTDLTKVFRRSVNNYDDDDRYVNSTGNDKFNSGSVNSRNNWGQPTNLTDINGVNTNLGYDSFGRQFFSSNNLGQTATTERSLTMSPAIGGSAFHYGETTTATGQPTVKKYFDKLGRAIASATQSFDGNHWIIQQSRYDINGRAVKQSLPYASSGESAQWNTSEYDVYGRTTSSSSVNGVDSTLTYNGLAITTTITPNDGEAAIQTKVNVKNILGESVSIIDNASTNAIRYSYNAVGNLVKVIGIDDVEIVTHHDNYGRKTSMVDPNKGNWAYSYNALGELITQTSGRGHITSILRDSIGRTTLKHTSGNGVDDSIDYQYNLSHLLQSESNNEQAKSYFYDTFGRMSSQRTVIDSVTYTQQTTFDQYGRVFQQFEADSSSLAGCFNSQNSVVGLCWGIENEYNNQGYLTTQKEARFGADTDATIYSHVKGMDSFGNVTILEQNDAKITTTNGINPITGQVENVTAISNGVAIQSNDYRFDALGNLRERTNNTLKTGTLGQSELFDYDLVNRLTHTNGVETVRYKNNGNIHWKKDVGYYCYNSASPHAVSGIGSENCTTQDYQYDANGNMYQGRNRNITYAHFDKATQITNTADNSTTAFSYGTNRSRYKRVTTEKVDDKNVTTTTYYIGNIEVVSKSDTTVVTTRRNLPGAIALWRTNGTRELSFLLKDHIGSLDTIADENGYVSQKLYFDAWGKKSIISSGSMNTTINAFTTMSLTQLLDVTTRGFTGHESVDHADIIHMNGRIYDPTLGRFLQADPFIQAPTNSQSYNRYSYVINNPLRYTDPSGYNFMDSLVKWMPAIMATVITVATAGAAGAIYASTGVMAYGTIAAGGALAGWVGSGFTAKGAVIGAFSAVTFASIGKTFNNTPLEGGAKHIGSHALAGGVISELQGGNFGHGFASAGLTKAMNINGISKAMGGTGSGFHAGMRIIAAAVIGGTISDSTGGKFANGAITAAFGQAFNGESVDDSFWESAKNSLSSYGPITSTLCHESMDGCTAQSAYRNLKRAPGPGGKGHTIENGQISELFVGRTQHFIDDKNLTVYNVAMKGHALYPGTVTRKVVMQDGWVTIQTSKQGAFTLMGVLSKIPSKALWRDVDLRIQRMMYQDATRGK